MGPSGNILARVLVFLLVFCAIVIIMTASYLQHRNSSYTIQSSVTDNHFFAANDKEANCLGKNLIDKWPRLKVELLEDILRNPRTRQVIGGLMSKQNESFYETLTSKAQVKQTDDIQKLKQANYSGIIPKEEKKQNPSPTKIESSLENFFSKPIINPFDITYRLNHPKLRCPKGTNVLIAVPSEPGNFARRKAVRMSNISVYSRNPENRAKIVFFLGSVRPLSNDKTYQERIDHEYILHEDIVQATFIDEYHNITKKSSLMLHWASTYCNEAKFFLRVDDDVKIQIKSAVRALEIKSLTFDVFILGLLKLYSFPIKNLKSKYFVPDSQWPKFKPYPPYLLGGAYGFPIKTAKLLLESIRRTDFLWLDDVFVTGVSAHNVGVPVFHDQIFNFKHLSKEDSDNELLDSLLAFTDSRGSFRPSSMLKKH